MESVNLVMFDRYIGIDYSGAKSSGARLPGLRVYAADRAESPSEVRPSAKASVHWTRHGIADWLCEQLDRDVAALIGVDHGFSFPRAYFELHGLPRDWPAFLDDVHEHWPTDRPDVTVDDVRRGRVGNGPARAGDARWRRLTEQRTGGAKSVFHFDVPGSVAKSTHAGLPWLAVVRRRCADRLHVWPFEGWDVPAGRSAIAEVYPSLWRDAYTRGDRTDDQHDAFVVAARLRDADLDGSLGRLLRPVLSEDETETARIEGWILGVT